MKKIILIFLLLNVVLYANIVDDGLAAFDKGNKQKAIELYRIACTDGKEEACSSYKKLKYDLFLVEKKVCTSIDIQVLTYFNNEGYCSTNDFFNKDNRLKLLKTTSVNNDILSDVYQGFNDVIKKTNNCKNQTKTYVYEEHLLGINDNVLAIQKHSYTWSGGAHGIEVDDFRNYDRNDGSQITWEQIFDDDKDFFNYVYNRVTHELADVSYIGQIAEVTGLQNNEIAKFTTIGYFSIQNDGLHIHFPAYTIAPYSSGYPTLSISLNILRKNMSKDKYTYYFENSKDIYFSKECETHSN